MEEKEILEIQKQLLLRLQSYEEEKPLKLEFSLEEFRTILFDVADPSLLILPDDLASKIDFTGFDWALKDVSNRDFSKYVGVKIDPQTVYLKKLTNSNFAGVIFKGSFEYCHVNKSKFKGSINTVINPQKILYKNLTNCDFEDVIFTDNFSMCDIQGSSFKGSTNAIIYTDKVPANNLSNCNFEDAKIIGSLNNCITYKSKFQGCLMEVEEIKKRFNGLISVEEDKTFQKVIL